MNARCCRAGLALLVLASAPLSAATINIHVTDSAGEGFNDPTPFTPIGGNNATTLGQARLNVFDEAARRWGLLLVSSVPIVVDAHFDPISGCTNTTGTLGQAGPTNMWLSQGYWYPQALHRAKFGSVGVTGSDIDAQFNSDVGSSGCLGGHPFYYGLDHIYNKQAYAADLLEVVMHELGHGLGFLSVVGSDGQGLAGTDKTPHLAVFDQFVFDETQGNFWPLMTAPQRATSALNDGNLVWNGANVNNQLGILTAGTTSGQHVRLYAPATWDDGSSVSHWDTTAAPNLLMEPFATGSTNGYTDLTTCVLYDIGWTGSHCPDTANAPPVASGQSVSTTAGTAVAITLTATDADTATLSYSIVSGPTHGVLSGSGSTRTYTPNAGFSGADSFTFQASDGSSNSNVATVSIAVSAAASGGSASANSSGGGGGVLTPWPLLALGTLALRGLLVRRRRGPPAAAKS